MRKIKDAVRLKAAGLSTRQIAASLGIGRTTAGDYLKRAADFDVGWPLPDDLTDEALEQRLFPSAAPTPKRARCRTGRRSIANWRSRR